MNIDINHNQKRGREVKIVKKSQYNEHEEREFKSKIGLDKKIDERHLDDDQLTKENIDDILSITGQNNGVTSQDITLFNQREDKTFRQEAIRNMFTYRSVLREGKYTSLDYINAVRYVTYISMGYSKRVSFTKVFPDRAITLRTSNPDFSESEYNNLLSSRATSYGHNKLVKGIMELSIIPSHLLYRDVYHEAINKQVAVMYSSRSDLVVQKASQFLIEHLSPPEEITEEAKANTNYLEELKKMNLEYANNALKALKAGTRNIVDINEAEYTVVEDNE